MRIPDRCWADRNVLVSNLKAKKKKNNYLFLHPWPPLPPNALTILEGFSQIHTKYRNTHSLSPYFNQTKMYLKCDLYPAGPVFSCVVSLIENVTLKSYSRSALTHCDAKSSCGIQVLIILGMIRNTEEDAVQLFQYFECIEYVLSCVRLLFSQLGI